MKHSRSLETGIVSKSNIQFKCTCDDLTLVVEDLAVIQFQNHPRRYEKPVSYYSDTAIDQWKICWLERDLNSHLRVSIDHRKKELKDFHIELKHCTSSKTSTKLLRKYFIRDWRQWIICYRNNTCRPSATTVTMNTSGNSLVSTEQMKFYTKQSFLNC
jgi:hypothetical protein